MKNNKGITLISLVMYIIGMIAIIAIIGVALSFYNKNLLTMNNTSDVNMEFNKFDTKMILETNTAGNRIEAVTTNSIKFASGNTYTFQDNRIYQNEIVVSEYVKEFLAKLETDGSKQMLKIYILFGKGQVEIVKNLSYTIEQIEATGELGNTIVLQKIPGISEWNGTVQTPYLMQGMVAVYWSTDGGATASTTQEGAIEIYSKIDGSGNPSSTGTYNTNFDWNQWYSYVAGDNTTDTKTSRWANAVTDDGSYWVWIPRFKYKIGEQPTEAGTSNAGKIDVIFIPTSAQTGASGYTTEANTEGEMLTTDSSGYIIHPAFENGSSSGKNNGFANGEWDSELAGFWIAKYEMSMEDGSGTNINTTSSTIGNVPLGTSVKMVSKPNKYSWRNIQIGQIYQNCINYDTAKESHMIKNSEWRSSSIFNT